MLKPFRYLAARVQGSSAEDNSSPPEPGTAAASTVVAAPVDAVAASVVRAAFESAMQEYGPAIIFDLQTEGLEKCDHCSGVVARLLHGCEAAARQIAVHAAGYCSQLALDTSLQYPKSLGLAFHQH
jgi:hypothetical protein